MSRTRDNKADRHHCEQAVAKYLKAIEFDPNNASAHAMLAEKYRKLGRMEAAIHEFRIAIGLYPHGPQSQRWKSQLRELLQEQCGVQKHNFTVCHSCQADLPMGSKTCSRCGSTLQMGFFEWLAKPQNFREVGRETVVVTMLVVTLFTIFSSLPLEWKACLLCAAVIVGGYYFLRGIGGSR
jgi:tetratricopeptide (TPR) repeat protein